MGPRRPLDIAELDTAAVLRCVRCGGVFTRVADYLAHEDPPVRHLTDPASVAAFADAVLEQDRVAVDRESPRADHDRPGRRSPGLVGSTRSPAEASTAGALTGTVASLRLARPQASDATTTDGGAG